MQVLRRTYSGQGAHVWEYGYGRTDDLGEYRIFGLSPGSYYVLATGHPYLFGYQGAEVARASRDEASMGYPPTYYPGTTDASRAVRIQVGAGAEIPGVDFLLAQTRTYWIRGHVSKAVGDASLNSVAVGARPRSDDSPQNEFSSHFVDPKTGNFEIPGVSSSTYILTAFWQTDGSVRRRESSQPVDVANADVNKVIIVLGPGIDISGPVGIEGKLAAGETLSVSLFSRHGGWGSGMQGGEVKADGSFVLSGVNDERSPSVCFRPARRATSSQQP